MSDPARSTSTGRDLGRAALASAAIGAGLIHAATVGPHAGHGVMPGLFATAAAIGVAAGVALLVRPTRPWLVAIAAVHLLMVAAWVASRTTGVSFVDGLEESEPIGFADAVATGCEALVALGSLVLLRAPRASRLPRPVAAAALAPVAMVFLLLAGPAVYVGATFEHGHGEGVESADGHSHGAATEDAAHGHSDAAATGESETAAHGHDSTTRGPFDPAAPIDLSGTVGVTQVQQKQAELILARSLVDLPKYAEQSAAMADGYRSIGDASTGDEHLISWDAINDEYVLDPQHPESLVYNTREWGKPPVLEAAMFILPDGYTLDNVPDLGGPLIQWHIHDDLCFTSDQEPMLAGVTFDGTCEAGLMKFPPHPMIHVWIQKNECGPFAALEGIGAGQTRDGTRSCDHAHGSAGTF